MKKYTLTLFCCNPITRCCDGSRSFDFHYDMKLSEALAFSKWLLRKELDSYCVVVTNNKTNKKHYVV